MSKELTLLQKYEPILCYTQGELFYPCAVEHYVERCSLWQRDAQGSTVCLVEPGALTLEKLATHSEIPENHTLYLRFVDEPMPAAELRNWRKQTSRPLFRAPGRLARVGLVSRILDGLFDLSLVIRGTVPGGTAAKAQCNYQEIQTAHPQPTYYGRVVHTGDYIVLHYLYFYAMNDWRSGFHGVNDHEGDWEQVFVFLADDGTAEPHPLWVAYASHEFKGDNLRRRWDDPELHLEGETHPVVYCGAGSHASYFLPGEYLMGIEPRYLRPLRNIVLGIQNYWHTRMGQGKTREQNSGIDYSDVGGDGHGHASHHGRLNLTSQRQQKVDAVRSNLSIPYIDYARGDGARIGYQQESTWAPVLLTEHRTMAENWVDSYRGLWGLDTQDFINGERAPAGPKFNQDGSVRQSWNDPLGWSGLDRVTPPHLISTYLTERIDELTVECGKVEAAIHEQRRLLRHASLEGDALQNTEYLNPLHHAQRVAMEDAQTVLQLHYAHLAELNESIAACRGYLQKVEMGDLGDPQAHLLRPHRPEPKTGEFTRLFELWAAVSVGLLLFILAGLLAYNRSGWLLRAFPVVIGFVAIEAAIRGQLANLLLSGTVLLAILTTLILVYEFFWPLIIGLLFILVVYMLVDNLRELSST